MELANNRLAWPGGVGRPAGDGQASLSRFSAELLDEAKCRAWLVGRAGNGLPACPVCRHPAPEAQHERFFAWLRLRCGHCGHFFRATSGTILEKAKLSPQQIALVFLGAELGLAPGPAARLAGISTEALREWRAKLARASF